MKGGTRQNEGHEGSREIRMYIPGEGSLEGIRVMRRMAALSREAGGPCPSGRFCMCVLQATCILRRRSGRVLDGGPGAVERRADSPMRRRAAVTVLACHPCDEDPWLIRVYRTWTYTNTVLYMPCWPAMDACYNPCTTHTRHLWISLGRPHHPRDRRGWPGPARRGPMAGPHAWATCSIRRLALDDCLNALRCCHGRPAMLGV